MSQTIDLDISFFLTKHCVQCPIPVDTVDVKIFCLLISSRRGWFPFSYTRVISEADGNSMRQLRVHKYVLGDSTLS